MDDDLIINDSNFGDYFFDVRYHKPQRGQVMARYVACADFLDGPLKRDIMEILLSHDARSTPKMMKKMACASEKDSYRLPIQMAKDLVGMSMEEVARKEYRFQLEMYFYTKKEYVPKDDPHWSIITLFNLDGFLDADNNRVTITTKEVSDEDSFAGPQPRDGEGVEDDVEAR